MLGYNGDELIWLLWVSNNYYNIIANDMQATE